MPKQKQQPHRPPDVAVGRDFRLCKAVFSAVASQILYSRYGFAPPEFQSVPQLDLYSQGFESLLRSGSPLDEYDPKLLIDQASTVFLRGDSTDYNVQRFLGMLRADIFPLIESEELVKFRISFLRSERLEAESLLEYYTIVLKYNTEGNYSIDIWRAGVVGPHISNTKFMLWNLGDYLSRLTPLNGPVYCTLSFHSSGRPTDALLGSWGFNPSDFDVAKLRLQQRHQYSFQKIACLVVGPPRDKSQTPYSPETEDVRADDTTSNGQEPVDAEPQCLPARDITPENVLLDDAGSVDEVLSENVAPADAAREDAKTPDIVMEDVATGNDGAEQLHEVATSDHSVDVPFDGQSESDTPLLRRPPEIKKVVAGKAGTEEKGRKQAKSNDGKPREGKKGVSRQQPPYSPAVVSSRAKTPNANKGRKRAVKGSPKAKGAPAQEKPPEKPTKPAPRPKRKAKQPLQIYSDPASNLHERQDTIPESQTLAQSANPGKRRWNEITHGADYPQKKRHQPVTEPSSGQMRLIDGVVLPSEAAPSSELSNLNSTPQLDRENMGSVPIEDDAASGQAVTTDRRDGKGHRNKRPVTARKGSLLEGTVFSDLGTSDAEENEDKLITGVEVTSDGEEDEYDEEGDEDDDDDEYEEED